MLLFPCQRLSLSRMPPAAVMLGGLALVTATSLGGCRFLPPSAQAQAEGDRPGAPGGASVPAVETAIAQTQSLDAALEYTGTTEPLQEVSVRPQLEGRLLDLSVNIGDRVEQGQLIGRVDERLVSTTVNEAQANLAALRAEVAQAEAEVNNARAQVEQARLELQQAEADARRLQALWQEGVVPEQTYELAETQRQTAAQALQSAQEQVSTRQQAVVAAQGRVAAQQATVQQAEERRSYTQLVAPIFGTVLERVIEPGNIVQPGDEILKLGDFSAIKVRVRVSELQLGQIRVGQPVQVRLDAFPNETFAGRVDRISPAADPTARLVPVEVVIPNRSGAQSISSGLLARVSFGTEIAQRVVVPQNALTLAEDESESSVFVATGTGEEVRVEKRTVQVSREANEQVEIVSGLNPGETFVVSSSQPLTDGQTVRLSILSAPLSP